LNEFDNNFLTSKIIHESDSDDVLQSDFEFGLCSTTVYGHYIKVSTVSGVGMDYQPYTFTNVTYFETGRCTTCVYLNGTSTNYSGFDNDGKYIGTF